MRLYSYILARDYGFAPNPFFGFCTLATCKPKIRQSAAVGDWIVGTGSKGYHLAGHIAFAMKISEVLTYDEYFQDARFQCKKPNLRNSLKQAYGDNIYHRSRKAKCWLQLNSHHSLPDGQANPLNVNHDTQTNRVLIGSHFFYWGGSGPRIPARFRSYKGFDVCCVGQGHKCNFPDSLVNSFIAWIESLVPPGYLADPAEF